ncbi:hypothetical protein [Streptomyces sp. NRRL B-24484]|uniref:hypothetical protein n=1 Tax=Streptomyces sp. NRRL B-24484 TaxID=1463833 RepID=UPI0004BEA8FA|nr:hypothetical protein [Streptomyces sp. NRRL B-24484]
MAAALEFRTEAKPDHGWIFVYDSDACVPDSAAARRSMRTVVAGIGPQLHIHSLQGTSPAEIVLRVWDAPVSGDVLGECEGFCPAVLDCPTGTVIVRAFVPEFAGCVELPRPGVYAALVSWRGREAAAAQQTSLLRSLGEPEGQADSDKVFAAHAEVLESYRIDLWWQYESDIELD